MASAKTGDPQTWNRFVFVLNNPLRYVDPDGLQERSAWEQLTEDERNILAVKLVKVKDSQNITKTELDAAGKKFNGLFKGLSDEKIEAGVTGFKNFIDAAGGHYNSEVWQQINQIEKFWIGDNNSVGIAVHVNNTSDFLKVLERNGYDVNAYYEVANKHGDHINSARMITDRSYQTSMHFVQQEGYTTRWDAHWDKMSVAFRRAAVPFGPLGSRKEEMAAAALDHIVGTPISAKQVRAQIRQRGMVPRNEP